MRTLNKNKQKMYYSLYLGQEPEYVLDDNGNKVVEYVDDDGNVYYKETGNVIDIYSEPVPFYGNISMSGGEVETVEFGLNIGDYEAVLLTSKNVLPITETSLIWLNTKPTDGVVKREQADYTVIKISPSLNQDKYVLKAVVK
jgi:hypothetical protein